MVKEIDDVVEIRLPYSEVCMHLRVAGQIRKVRILSDNAAQILDVNGDDYSFPVLWSEVGVRRSEDGRPIVPVTITRPDDEEVAS